MRSTLERRLRRRATPRRRVRERSRPEERCSRFAQTFTSRDWSLSTPAACVRLPSPLFIHYELTSLLFAGVRDRALLTTALDVTPPFLRTAQATAGAVVDLRNMGLALGRRFRSLKLYFVLRSYGVEGFQAHLRKLDGLAQTLVKLAAGEIDGVAALAGVELFAPHRFSLVVFRIRSTNPSSSSLAYENALNAALIRIANDDHSLILTPTTVGGMNSIRVAIGSSFTEERHIRALVEKLRALVKQAREETEVV